MPLDPACVKFCFLIWRCVPDRSRRAHWCMTCPGEIPHLSELPMSQNLFQMWGVLVEGPLKVSLGFSSLLIKRKVEDETFGKRGGLVTKADQNMDSESESIYPSLAIAEKPFYFLWRRLLWYVSRSPLFKGLKHVWTYGSIVGPSWVQTTKFLTKCCNMAWASDLTRDVSSSNWCTPYASSTPHPQSVRDVRYPTHSLCQFGTQTSGWSITRSGSGCWKAKSLTFACGGKGGDPVFCDIFCIKVWGNGST